MQINKNIAVPAAVGVGSLSLGFVSGYFFHKWRIEKSVRDFITEMHEPEDMVELNFGQVVELNEAKRNHPTAIITERVVRDPHEEPSTDVVIEETDEELIISFDDHVEEEPEPERVSIFTTDEDTEWNYDYEMARRAQVPDKPHIIHVDEYFESHDNDYRQHVLTYYAGDDILCDENSIPMYNAKEVVGDIKNSFGHGSKDQNILYVRNVPLDAEYEIIRDPGHYAVEVLGGEIEDEYETGDIKHSHSPHKFRE